MALCPLHQNIFEVQLYTLYETFEMALAIISVTKWPKKETWLFFLNYLVMYELLFRSEQTSEMQK